MQKTEGLYHLKQPDNRCPFLTASGCTIYEARPTQCRTWPFWAENMNEKVWEEDIVPFCDAPRAQRGASRKLNFIISTLC
jgi:hypothetical protein